MTKYDNMHVRSLGGRVAVADLWCWSLDDDEGEAKA
jgi:hypothetical protein